MTAEKINIVMSGLKHDAAMRFLKKNVVDKNRCLGYNYFCILILNVIIYW